MDALDELIGQSPSIVALRRKIRALVQQHREGRRLPPVLIQGETGTGKGLLARLMHRVGPRANGPFVDINCAAIPETLLEAELFGFERGAFTDARQSKPGLFQVAHGGTLFLDEIGLLARTLQAKLLSVLEQGSVRRLGSTTSEATNVAIVAATNEPLLAAVHERRFREDLYHRLAVLTVDLPSLRERGDDIELLAHRMLAHVCEEYGVSPKSLDRGARAALRTYHWPGNVRELANVIERVALLVDSDTVTADALGLVDLVYMGGLDGPPKPPDARQRPGKAVALLDSPRSAAPRQSRGAPRSSGGAPRSSERLLMEALEATGWNITRTASRLGVTRNTVRAWMRQYDVRRPGAAEPAIVEAPAAPMPAPPPIARWERRAIAFLRARIVVAPDTSARDMSRGLDRLVEKAQSFGGRVHQITPRSLVATFGDEPVEDAPRRAANAALAITKSIERGREAGDLSPGIAVTLVIDVRRVAVARIGGRTAIDQDAEREVSRGLEAIEPAAGGQVVATDSARTFLDRYFELRPAQAHPGHLLVGRRTAVAGVQGGGFVGRRREVDLLLGLLDRALLGQGQILALVGEPGVGKSRLVHEFRQTLPAQGLVILEGRCVSYGTHVPYLPVIDILQSVCGLQEGEGPDAIDAKVAAVIERLGEAGAASAPFIQYLLHPRSIAALQGQSPEAIKRRTFEALRQLIIEQQERQAVILVVEDLQWIDQTSEELLALLAEIVGGTRILLVTTSRPGYQPRWIAKSNVTQLAVGPLSAAESRRVVQSILGARPEGDLLVAGIVARADGNPFFLEELAHSVRERPDPVRLVIPGTIHEVLAARIDALPELDRHVLRLAAVIGRDVPVTLLQDVGGASPDDLRAGLARLQSSEMLVATRFGAEPEYAFKHALTHDVAYDSVPEATRAPLHARVADAIERLAPETRERRPEILARHYTAAGRIDKAIAYGQRAGRLAIQRSANAEAIAHLTTALALVETLPAGPDRSRSELALQLALSTALAAHGGYGVREVERTLARVHALTEELGEAPELPAARFGLWRFSASRADFKSAEGFATQLLAAAAPGDAEALIPGHTAAGITAFYTGCFQRAAEHFEHVLRLHRPEFAGRQIALYGNDLHVGALSFLGWTRALTGQLDAGAALAGEALACARSSSHPLTVALALNWAGLVHGERHEPALVERIGEELLALSREQGFAFFVALAIVHVGWARFAQGDRDGGVDLLREGYDRYLATSQRVGLRLRAHLAEALVGVGAIDEALARLEEFFAHTRQTGEGALLSELYRIRGEALQVRAPGDPEAERSLQHAHAIAGEQGATTLALRAATSLVRLQRERGGPVPGLAVLRDVYGTFTEGLDLHAPRAARALIDSDVRESGGG